MKLNIYAIYDSCSGIYQNPVNSHSDGEIIRNFGDIAQDAEHQIGQHPEHYSLWRLGTYDNQNAQINIETKECVATALELLSASKNPNPDHMDMLNTNLMGENAEEQNA